MIDHETNQVRRAVILFLVLCLMLPVVNAASSIPVLFAQVDIRNFEEARKEGKEKGLALQGVLVQLHYSRGGYNPQIDNSTVVALGFSDKSGLVKLEFDGSDAKGAYKTYSNDDDDQYHWISMVKAPVMGEQAKQKPHLFLGKSEPGQTLGLWMNGAIRGLATFKTESMPDEVTITLNSGGQIVRQTKLNPTSQPTAEFQLEDISPGEEYTLLLDAINHHNCRMENVKILPGDVFGIDEAQEDRFEFMFEMPVMDPGETEVRDYTPKVVPYTGIGGE